MRWDAVFQAIATRMSADPTLTSIYGDAIREMGVAKFRVPSLEYMLVVEGRPVEQWQPHTIQFSQWTRTLDEMVTSDRRLRALFDHSEPVFIEGVYMWSFFLESVDLTGPEREGFHAKATRYEFTPIRADLLAGRS